METEREVGSKGKGMKGVVEEDAREMKPQKYP